VLKLGTSEHVRARLARGRDPFIHEQPRIAAGLAALPGGVALRPIRDSNIPANRLAFLAAVSPGYAPVETDWH